ncbi:hypothetical protein [Streptomyces sp. NBC_01235]|uniref:hypothetical protein n=1 Tax=Streptomyces sp. NBC_01235 TaxID=2903788 RepID=UPI002E1347B4|nr:hypothetical protein OG289_04905 [Streptomyces sp. NBC_01235]
MLRTAANRASNAEITHVGLVAFRDRRLLPHAAAEESAPYPAAHGMSERCLLSGRQPIPGRFGLMPAI